MRLWIEESREGEASRFECRELASGGLSLLPGRAVADGRSPDALAALVPFAERGREAVALVLASSAGRLLLNGFPPLPVSVLEDRDEIQLEGRRLYLAAHAVPAPRRFEGGGGPVECGRCRRELVAGNPGRAGDEVVRCPVCGTPHHEGERAAPGAGPLHCWSYDPRCAGPCRRRREELAWSPEEEEEEGGDADRPDAPGG
jgi:hypothetical protein